MTKSQIKSMTNRKNPKSKKDSIGLGFILFGFEVYWDLFCWDFGVIK
jgi:hypothetical protein